MKIELDIEFMDHYELKEAIDVLILLHNNKTHKTIKVVEVVEE